MDKNSEIGFKIKAISNEFKRFIDRQLGNDDGTGMHYGILHFIQRQERDVYQRDIEKEFHIRRSTATGMLQLMEKKGLIRRESVDYDARLKKLIVTEKAIESTWAINQEAEKLELQIREGISEEDLDVFFKVLDKISKNIS